MMNGWMNRCWKRRSWMKLERTKLRGMNGSLQALLRLRLTASTARLPFALLLAALVLPAEGGPTQEWIAERRRVGERPLDAVRHQHLELDVLAEQPAQQPAALLEHPLQIERLRIHHLLAAEGEELAGQGGGGVVEGQADIPRRGAGAGETDAPALS